MLYFSIEVKKYKDISGREKNISFERIKCVNERWESVRRECVKCFSSIYIYIYIYIHIYRERERSRFRSQGSEDGSRLSRNGWSITDSFGNSPPSQSRALHGSLCARRREEENEGQARTSLTRKYRQGSLAFDEAPRAVRAIIARTWVCVTGDRDAFLPTEFSPFPFNVSLRPRNT